MPRPRKIDPRYQTLWVQVSPAVIAALDDLAAEISRVHHLRYTRQDAVRVVLDGWAEGMVKKGKRRGMRKRTSRG